MQAEARQSLREKALISMLSSFPPHVHMLLKDEKCIFLIWVVWGDRMNRMTRHEKKKARIRNLTKSPIHLSICFLLMFAFFYLLYKHSIKIEAPKKDLGEKVVIHLPDGETIYTYENLIVKENGKVYFKGERNTIDLTGGKITYEEWE